MNSCAHTCGFIFVEICFLSVYDGLFGMKILAHRNLYVLEFR